FDLPKQPKELPKPEISTTTLTTRPPSTTLSSQTKITFIRTTLKHQNQYLILMLVAQFVD
ncbi:1516_t:CDS:1, partial [Gigaspora margarita]